MPGQAQVKSQKCRCKWDRTRGGGGKSLLNDRNDAQKFSEKLKSQTCKMSACR